MKKIMLRCCRNSTQSQSWEMYSQVLNVCPSDTPCILALGASEVVLVIKNMPASSGDIRDAGSVPGLGRSPGGGNGNQLQYSCLGNPMDRGAWQSIVPEVTRSRTQLGSQTTWCFHSHRVTKG